MPPAWKMTRSLLVSLRAAAGKIYPMEFIAMLGVSASASHTMSEFIILPAEFGYTHSGLHTELIPTDELIVGTIHSHPSRSMRASEADLAAFSRLGKVHLILGHPFRERDFRAYSASGELLSLEIVD